ncbi:MAG: Ig-like domain-containing protein, partial [Cyanobacteria bacterium P01_G01_bin.19]
GGTVEINSQGDGLIYSPAPEFVGEETFTYTVSDGQGENVQADVTVTVEEEEDASIFSTDWDNLNGWNQSGTDISIEPEGKLRLFDNADRTTKVFRSDVDITGAYSIEFQVQVDQYTTDNKVSLGVKVQDGDFRLMFQRRADGFYVIDDSNSWVLLPDPDGNFQSEFTESQDYRIDVDNGIGVLSSRASAADNFVVEGQWNLQPFQRSDLIEHWVRGTSENPAEALFDMTEIF